MRENLVPNVDLRPCPGSTTVLIVVITCSKLPSNSRLGVIHPRDRYPIHRHLTNQRRNIVPLFALQTKCIVDGLLESVERYW
jgi:hypothetical protein